MRPALLLLALTLVLAPTGRAVFIETPLRLTPSSVEADVGDALQFDVAPANDSAAAQYAGRTLTLHYAYDAETEGQQAGGDAGTVTLDDQGAGRFTWTVPADVDDKNVFLSLMDGDEGVGSAHVRVGDAPPTMFAAGGMENGGGEVVEETPTPETQKDSPGFTALAILGGACVAVLVLTLRRR